MRLETALEAARVLLEQRERHPDSEFVQWELEDSLEALRGLRTRFILQCDSIRNRFLKEWKPSENPYVRRRIEQISHVLSDARAVLIAGGHVGVLRNRLEFFELAPMLSALIERDGAVIAWSAGAMALTELVVLFHDDPPTGQLHAEVLDHGLGLASGIVVLPHARDRLFLDDPSRVSVMASRFRPHPCIGIENGAWLHRRGDTWVNLGETESAFRLHADGTVAPIETASSEVGDASDI